MVKLLVHKGKHQPMYFDISTHEKAVEAYKRLFGIMQEEGYYEDSMSPRERELYRLIEADGPDVGARVIEFLTRRSNAGYEYEGIQLTETEN